jgi:hypothetical protein
LGFGQVAHSGAMVFCSIPVISPDKKMLLYSSVPVPLNQIETIASLSFHFYRMPTVLRRISDSISFSFFLRKRSKVQGGATFVGLGRYRLFDTGSGSGMASKIFRDRDPKIAPDPDFRDRDPDPTLPFWPRW